ncbi:MAG: hypothetical protein H0W39_03940 [Sphingomonas sp.]|nr:hypothetical protein [Sphingomonas sp.]
MRRYFLGIFASWILSACSFQGSSERAERTIAANRADVFAAMTMSIQESGLEPVEKAQDFVRYEVPINDKNLLTGPEADAALTEKYLGGTIAVTVEPDRSLESRMISADGNSSMRVQFLFSDGAANTTIIESHVDVSQSGLPSNSQEELKTILLQMPNILIDEAEEKLANS